MAIMETENKGHLSIWDSVTSWDKFIYFVTVYVYGNARYNVNALDIDLGTKKTLLAPWKRFYLIKCIPLHFFFLRNFFQKSKKNKK